MASQSGAAANTKNAFLDSVTDFVDTISAYVATSV